MVVIKVVRLRQSYLHLITMENVVSLNCKCYLTPGSATTVKLTTNMEIENTNFKICFEAG